MDAPLDLAGRLIERRLISAEEMDRVLKLQHEQQAPFTRLVVELGFISEDDLLPVLRDHFDLPLTALKDFPTTALPLEFSPGAIEFFKHARIVPVKLDGRELSVAITDPLDIARLHSLELATGLRVKPLLAKEKEIAARIDALFGSGYSSESPGPAAAREIEGIVDEEDVAHLRDMASEVTVIRLVNQMLVRALESRASDVHIEPFENQLKVRYRIDGILHEVEPPPRQLRAAVISRLKILAQLNIAERRLPQDGRIKIRLGGKDVDLRIATVPTLYGESVVIRLLERGQIFTQLEALGFPPDLLEQFNAMILKPHGMILVTGPTGSGKTTTLYSILNHINSDGVNIMTLEDPVEYPMTLIRQTSVADSAKLDFANGIRAMMRQDPDAILVGEIRDRDTAEMAFRAAMTGHQVYSTLHTNSAVGAIPRLLDIGIVPDIMSGNIIGIVAQRLVRRLCRTCRQSYDPDVKERRLVNLTPSEPAALYRAVGCEQCDYQGYRGRASILEILKIDGGLDELIARRATAREILTAARAKGFKTLADDGVRMVRAGLTSLEELMRVVDLTDRMA
jgi:general secretion pathway protein E/type IV pilus assembly protein PilB